MSQLTIYSKNSLDNLTEKTKEYAKIKINKDYYIKNNWGSLTLNKNKSEAALLSFHVYRATSCCGIGELQGIEELKKDIPEQVMDDFFKAICSYVLHTVKHGGLIIYFTREDGSETVKQPQLLQAAEEAGMKLFHKPFRNPNHEPNNWIYGYYLDLTTLKQE